ncbi:hypothetical protein ACFBZI_11040 [Moraxella sp. ZJ142]|uniref:hypothetical protein n=1 Tax=Moraxella marmotae TaxID=3344520 RepID=UPI0035D3F131
MNLTNNATIKAIFDQLGQHFEEVAKMPLASGQNQDQATSQSLYNQLNATIGDGLR